MKARFDSIFDLTPRTVALAVLLPALALCACRGDDAAGLTDMITVDKPTTEFELEERYRLGVDEPLFASIGSVVIDSSGVLYVADGSDPPAVHTFETDGSYRGVFGSAGEGPGEYARVSAVLAAGDSVIIHDTRRDLISVFSQDGTFRRSVQRTGDAPVTSANIIAVRPGGYLAIQAPSQMTGMKGTETRGYAYRLVGADGVLGDSIWTSPRKDYLTYATEDIVAAMDRPFGRTTQCTTARGILTCAWSADLLFNRIAIDGDTLPSIRVPFEPIPVTAAEKAKAHRNVHEWFADQLDVPDTRPALAELASDNHGRLWAKVVIDTTDQRSTYWVIDPETKSTWFATIEGNVELRVIRNDIAVGILTDQVGQEFVVRYDIRTPTGDGPG